MATKDLGDGLALYYEDDYFGPAWLEPEAVVLVHGVAESSVAWRAWVPALSAKYRN
jgi:3-oxoadipate enol-lactonase